MTQIDMICPTTKWMVFSMNNVVISTSICFMMFICCFFNLNVLMRKDHPFKNYHTISKYSQIKNQGQ